jgi:hypothetical protein
VSGDLRIFPEIEVNRVLRRDKVLLRWEPLRLAQFVSPCGAENSIFEEKFDI